MGGPRAQVELSTTESRIKFLTRTVYDLLQTPASKNKWYEEDERCNLCNEIGILNLMARERNRVIKTKTPGISTTDSHRLARIRLASSCRPFI